MKRHYRATPTKTLLATVHAVLRLADLQGQPRVAKMLQAAVAVAEGRRPQDCPLCGSTLTTSRGFDYCSVCEWVQRYRVCTGAGRRRVSPTGA